MLGIDECANAAIFLALGNGLETECGFTGGFRTENFNHTAAGQAADAERQVHAEGAGGNNIKVFFLLAAVHFHDGAFAEVFFDLGKGGG